MKHKTIKILSVFLSLCILILGIYGLNNAAKRGGFPFLWDETKNKIIITKVTLESEKPVPPIRENDSIVSIEGWGVNKEIDVNYILDSKKTGQTVSCIIKRENQQFLSRILLNNHYKPLSVLLHLCFGIFFWIIGLFVLLKKSTYKPARVFWCVCMSVSLSAMFIWNGYPYNYSFSAFIHPVLNFIVYPLVPSFVLWFTLIYPAEKKFLSKKFFHIVYLFLPSFAFILLLERYYLDYILTHDFNAYQFYTILYNGFRFFLVCYLVGGMTALIHSLIRSGSKENRNRVLWILGSFIFGTVPFLFLWTLPLVLGIHPPFIEEINYIFLLAIPIACAISIIKYQLFDIDFIINRGIVYSITTGFIIILYLSIVVGISHILYTKSPQMSNLIAIVFTVVIAILFSPLKNRVQTFVDKTFYRVRYNYQLAIQNFSKVLTLAQNPKKLPSLLIQHINSAIPCERIALIIKSDKKYILQGSAGIPKNEQECLIFNQSDEIIKDIKKEKKAFIKEDRGDLLEASQLPNHTCLDLLNIELIVPIFIQHKLKAFFLFGKKRADTRFTYQDLELIVPIAEEGILTMDRLNIQAAMLFEKSAKEKLAELNRLKSEFVSHVSHELKNPLTSIALSVNNLLEGIPEKPKPGIENYLKMIQECSNHLEHMITNLLDITKIEADKIDIHLEKINLQESLQSAKKVILPLVQKKKISINESIDPNIFIYADKDWLRTILINLIDNAIKYTNEKDTIHIQADISTDHLKKDDPLHFVDISVIDHGRGIPLSKQKIIFKQFERLKESPNQRQHGLGLGLYIVQKLIVLHGGEIKVKSIPGKGSTFTFTLPGV